MLIRTERKENIQVDPSVSTYECFRVAINGVDPSRHLDGMWPHMQAYSKEC